MLGFVIGTVCLVGLIKVLRGHRYGHGWRGGSCGCHGPDACGGPGGSGRHRHGPWDAPGPMGFDDFPGGPGRDEPPVMLRGLFGRLRTTPGQERVILEALRELRTAARRAADEKAKSARQVAEALRSDDFRTENMGEAFVHLESGAEALRDATFAALAKIHAALDERQRKDLADAIARGANVLEHLAAQA